MKITGQTGINICLTVKELKQISKDDLSKLLEAGSKDSVAQSDSSRESSPAPKGPKVILVDSSGSRGDGAIAQCTRAALKNALAVLNAAGVPYAVAAFSDTLTLLKGFSAPGSDIATMKALKGLDAVQHGGTNDARALKEIGNYVQKNRFVARLNGPVQVVLIGDGEGEPGARQTVEDLRNQNIHVIGVGLTKDARYLQESYGKAGTVETPEQLTDALLNVLKMD